MIWFVRFQSLIKVNTFIVLLWLMVRPPLLSEDKSVSGFISQGLIYTSDNNFYGDSESVSAEFTEIGINMLWQIGPNFNFFGQLLSRRAGEIDNGKIKLDYLGIDYQLFRNDQQRLNFRAGRLKNSLGIYNETRDVAFTRPTIFLPQSIYFDRLRDLELSSDGLKLNYEWQANSNRIMIDLGYGRPIANEDTQINYTVLNDSNSEFSDEDFSQLRIWADWADGEWVSAVSYLDGSFFINITPDQLFNLNDGDFNLEGFIFSAQYNSEFWTFSGEYFLVETRYELGPFALNNVNDTVSYYLQTEYRFSPELTLVGRADFLYIEKNDKSGAVFEQQTGLPGHTRFAKDLSLTLRWQFHQSWLAMIEYHHIDGTAWLFTRENPNLLALEKDWSMLTTLLSFRF